ncbi:hypothetical protein SAMN02745150_01267 [Brevinema andersonii]|uniref:Uncharacterized protein n=1 Tax=Brevinema andersonii TaxID=34097 RepID=A0A1I1ETU9_BREAD|nr:hypothetical protein [Brevinema andersonii]SFB90565.1 hypothetical protein SAMN02745150_01267 [Brevinema andersonii]
MLEYGSFVTQIVSFFQSINLDTYLQMAVAIGSIAAVLVSIRALEEPLRTQLGIYPVHRNIINISDVQIKDKNINQELTPTYITIKNSGQSTIEDLKISINADLPSVPQIFNEEHSAVGQIFDLEKLHAILYGQRIADLEQKLSLLILPQHTTHTVFFGNIMKSADYFDSIIYYFPYKGTWHTHFISEEMQVPYIDSFDIYRVKIPELYSILAVSQLIEKLFGKEYLYEVLLYLRYYAGVGKKYLENGIYSKKWNTYMQNFLETLIKNDIIHKVGRNHLVELSNLLNHFAELDASSIKQVEHICRIITNAYEQIFKDGIRIYLPNCLEIKACYKNIVLNRAEIKIFPIDILTPIEDLD